MHVLLLFGTTALASFVGSLQAGLVNTAVLNTTLREGRAAGRRMAWGGAVPEFLYAAVAFQWAEWLREAPALANGKLERLAGAVLILFGLYLIFFLKPFTAGPQTAPPGRSGFFRGVVVGLMNPQLLVFWCGVRLGLGMVGVETAGVLPLLAFAGGAWAGAMALLLVLVQLGARLQAWARPTLLRWLFRLLGLSLVGAGIWAWWLAVR